MNWNGVLTMCVGVFGSIVSGGLGLALTLWVVTAVMDRKDR